MLPSWSPAIEEGAYNGKLVADPGKIDFRPDRPVPAIVVIICVSANTIRTR